LGALGALIARRLASLDETIVAQGPGEFLWASERLVGVVTLLPVAFVSALPASLALLFPWGADAAREQAPTPRAFRIARAVAFAWLVAISIYVALGVSNPRYVIPAAAFLPPLVGWVLASRGEGFTAVRARIARGMCLGSPVIMMVVLIAGGVIYAKLTSDARRADSGRAFGRQMAERLPTGAVVIADHAVEARPEILLAAREHAERQGKVLRPIWHSGLNPEAKVLSPQATAAASVADTVASRHFLLLRLDAGSNESQKFLSGADERLYRVDAIVEGRVGAYLFGLFEVIHQKQERALQPETTPP
jgi:hypothetical protein